MTNDILKRLERLERANGRLKLRFLIANGLSIAAGLLALLSLTWDGLLASNEGAPRMAQSPGNTVAMPAIPPKAERKPESQHDLKAHAATGDRKATEFDILDVRLLRIRDDDGKIVGLWNPSIGVCAPEMHLISKEGVEKDSKYRGTWNAEEFRTQNRISLTRRFSEGEALWAAVDEKDARPVLGMSFGKADKNGSYSKIEPGEIIVVNGRTGKTWSTASSIGWLDQ